MAESKTKLQYAYGLLARLHDLWILLAWSGIIGGLMLNTIFHRSCLAYTQGNDPLATCQGAIDLAFLFATGIVAGLLFSDERVGLVGFLPAHVIGTIVFISIFLIPVSGLGDPILVDAMTSRSLALAVNYEFPFQIILSFVGCALGVFFRDKFGFAGAVSEPED